MRARPSLRHRLYAKISKPSVKRWIRPDADPDPKVWMLAEEVEAKQIQPPSRNPVQMANKPDPNYPPKETKTESKDPLSSIPEVAVKAEAKTEPKAKPGRKPKSAPKKSETKTNDSE